MNQLAERLGPIWQNLSSVCKFLLAIVLIALYFGLILTKAPSTLTNPANLLLFLIATIYTGWQALHGYWQIKDIRWNYTMLKHLQHPLKADHTFWHLLYLAIISEFDPLSEAYTAKLLDEGTEAEAELENAEKDLQAVLAYEKLLQNTFSKSIERWNDWQAFCKARLQKAIDHDIGFTKTDRRIIGELSKQIIKQRKKLIYLQKKAIWPEPVYYKFITCLYHVIPKEVKGSELIKQSLERLYTKDFWTEYINEALPKDATSELFKYLQLIDQAKAKIKKQAQP